MCCPRITVVTPSYNQQRFLQKTLDSVLGQSYPNLEYIVMDGGSTDGSVDILRGAEDRLAHWQSAHDAGQGSAIIDGWKRSTGEIVTWINSDDMLLPNALHLAALAFEGGTDMVIGDSLSIDEHGVARSLRPLWRGPLWMYRAGILTFGQPGTFYRRSLVEHVGYFDRDLEFAMEHDLTLRLLEAGAGVYYANRPLAALRVYGETKTQMNPEAISNELRKVYSTHVRAPFQAESTRRIARFAARHVYAARYLLPSNAAKTRMKVELAKRPLPVDDIDWSRLT